MKYARIPILLVALLLIIIHIGACSGGDADPPSGSAEVFVAFKIDGKAYRIEADNMSLIGSYAAAYTFSPPFTYSLVMSIGSATNSDIASVGIVMGRTAPFEAIRYDSLNIIGGAQVVCVLPNLYQYVMEPSSSGFIEFSEIDTTLGGVVAGTFEFDELRYTDASSTTLSTGHTLTDGSFRFVLD